MVTLRLLALMGPTFQTAGTWEIDWDGTNPAGEIVTLEGSYTLEIRATSAVTGQTDTRRVSAVVYR